MTRQDITIYLQTLNHSLTAKDADAYVTGVFEAIRAAVARGEDVTLRGFGSFRRSLRARREARNPTTGEPVTVDEHYVVKFKPGKEFKDAVKRR